MALQEPLQGLLTACCKLLQALEDLYKAPVSFLCLSLRPRHRIAGFGLVLGQDGFRLGLARFGGVLLCSV